MKLIFLNRFAHPDLSATSQLLSDLAFDLAATGEQVHIITSRQRYEDAAAALPPHEVIDGVHFHRVHSTAYGRSRLTGRAIDYLSFYASMRQAILRIAETGDVLIAMTDPPLISILANGPARRRGAHLVNWLQDVYPEIATGLGVPAMHLVGKPIAWLRDRSLQASAINVAVGERMREALRERGISDARLRVIPNWTNDDIVPLAAAENAMRAQLNLADKFVIGYSGNLGRAHEYRTVLEAAGQLSAYPEIVFLFIGAGHGHAELRKEITARSLDAMFRFLPYQPRDMLKYSMNVPDVHWMSLRPELEGFVVPSKFYSAAAAGRPIIAIGAADGEIGRLVQRYDCGRVCAPGDSEALVRIVLDMRCDRARTSQMGQHARAMLDREFTKSQALTRWRGVFADIRSGETAQV